MFCIDGNGWCRVRVECGDADEVVMSGVGMFGLIPLRRLGQADEVAALVGFLCSDAAAYITRQVIAINGGII